MTSTLPALRDFSDRLSPMVVKEMRQGLRTRFFTAALILFHLALVIIMLTLLLEDTINQATENFWRVLIAVLAIILPLQGFSSLTKELREGTLDMLRLTGISTLRMVWGKWLTLFSQILLVTSSLLPYMIARYRLGGVEIVGELIALFIVVVVSALSTASMIAFSWQESIWMRLITGAATLLVNSAVSMFAFDIVSDEYERQLVVSLFLSFSIMGWMLFVIFLVGVLSGWVAYFLCIGAGRCGSTGENLTRRKRRLLLVLVTSQMVFYPTLSSVSSEAGFALMVVTLALVLLAGVDLTTEEMPTIWPELGITKTGIKHRWNWQRLFYPGWASGVFFYVLLCLIFLALLAMRAKSFGIHFPRSSSVGLFWSFCCLLQASFISVCMSRYAKARFTAWWCIHLGLHAIGAALYFSATSLGLPELALIGFLTPVTAVYAVEAFPGSMSWLPAISAFWGLVWVVVALGQAWLEGRLYVSLEKSREHDLGIANHLPSSDFPVTA